jgi:hypothetical protein
MSLCYVFQRLYVDRPVVVESIPSRKALCTVRTPPTLLNMVGPIYPVVAHFALPEAKIVGFHIRVRKKPPAI